MQCGYKGGAGLLEGGETLGEERMKESAYFILVLFKIF